MKETLYTIYFTNGKTSTKHTFSPMDAAVLAMAEAIKGALSKDIDSIQDEETGEVFTFEARIRISKI